MARSVHISQEAIYDLESIWDFISQDNPNAADSFIDELYKKCCSIAKLDGIGRSRDDLDTDLLSIPHKRYVIFFVRDETSVQIVRILNAALDVENQFDT
ncbi:MAG: type II toxin-antitoxin system RelE/ParE family toxin [Coraliomargarita sp.]